MQAENQKEKSLQTKDLCSIIKHTNICRESQKKKEEKNCSSNGQKLIKSDEKNQSTNSVLTSSQIKTNRSPLRHIIAKLWQDK